MSKHGFYNTLGHWVEEPCNAYCRGDYHVMVVYTTESGAANPDGLAWSFWERNPMARVLEILPAMEAPPAAERRFHPGQDKPVLIRWEERP